MCMLKVCSFLEKYFGVFRIIFELITIEEYGEGFLLRFILG